MLNGWRGWELLRLYILYIVQTDCKHSIVGMTAMLVYWLQAHHCNAPCNSLNIYDPFLVMLDLKVKVPLKKKKVLDVHPDVLK